MRAQGAATVLFDLNFNNRDRHDGEAGRPVDDRRRARRRSTTTPSGHRLPDPVIAENELFGAQTPTPWSDTNAQYRANALALPPGPRRARRAARAHDREPAVHRRRRGRMVARGREGRDPRAPGLLHLAEREGALSARPGGGEPDDAAGACAASSPAPQIGIPAGRIALELQFHSAPGLGARAGLQPASAWFEIVKLEALAAKQVAKEFKIEGVWSWGWATFSAAAPADPDKPFGRVRLALGRAIPPSATAPKYVGAGVRRSLTEASSASRRARAACCRTGSDRPRRRQPAHRAHRRLRLRGERPPRAGRASRRAAGRPKDVLLGRARGDRAPSFGGSRPRYLAALRRAADARRRARDHRRPARARPGPGALPSARGDAGAGARLPRDVRGPARAAREHDASGAVARRRRAGLGRLVARPAGVFTLDGQGAIDTADGSFEVTPLGPAQPLALVPRAQARAAAKAALDRLARGQCYRSWLHGAGEDTAPVGGLPRRPPAHAARDRPLGVRAVPAAELSARGCRRLTSQRMTNSIRAALPSDSGSCLGTGTNPARRAPGALPIPYALGARLASSDSATEARSLLRRRCSRPPACSR